MGHIMMWCLRGGHALVLAIFCFAAAACGDDDTDTGDPGNTGDTGGTTGSPGTSTDTAGTGGTTDGADSTDNTGDTGDATDTGDSGDAGTAPVGDYLGDAPGLFPGFADELFTSDRAPERYAPSADIQIRRDELGMAHVKAETETDAHFGMGYAMAHDRLLQMDLLRRQASGRLSEVFGRKRLTNDTLYRNFGLYRYARENWRQLKKDAPEVARVVAAFSAGVNRYIDDAKAGKNGARLAPGYAFAKFEPEYWHPIDSFAIGKVITFGLTSTLEAEMITTIGNNQSAVPKGLTDDVAMFRPLEDVYILMDQDYTLPGTEAQLVAAAEAVAAQGPRSTTTSGNQTNNAQPAPAQDLAAILAQKPFESLASNPWLGGNSNSWVLHGRATESGKPIIANDTHLTFSLPTVWYPVHYATTDGKIDTIGVAFQGTPYVLLGQNGNVAWSATTLIFDAVDLYGVKLNAEKTGYEMTDGTFVPVVKFTEQIKVRKEGAATTAEFDVETLEWYRSDRHGHIMSGKGDATFALATSATGKDIGMRWTGHGYGDESIAFYALTQLKTCDKAALREALKTYSAGGQNFSCADKTGNVGYHAKTLAPLRRSIDRTNPPWSIMPPDRKHDWLGFKSDDYLPFAFIPANDTTATPFIPTANNDPFGYTLDNDLFNDPQYVGGLYDPGVRYAAVRQRLQATLDQGQKFTPESSNALQNNDESRIVERLYNVLRPLIDATQTDPALAAYKDDPRYAAVLEQLEILKNAKFSTSIDSTGTTIVSAWMGVFALENLRDKFGLTLLFDQIASRSAYLIRPVLLSIEGGEGLPGKALAVDDLKVKQADALKRALDFLEDLYESDKPTDWAWGDWHQIDRRISVVTADEIGPDLVKPTLPMAGWISTISVADYNLAPSSGNSGLPPDILSTRPGAGMRHITTWDSNGKAQTWNVFPGGVSGFPTDPHNDDQIDDFLAGRTFKQHYDEADVVANTVSTVTVAK
jgi:penicillin G amidase